MTLLRSGWLPQGTQSRYPGQGYPTELTNPNRTEASKMNIGVTAVDAVIGDVVNSTSSSLPFFVFCYYLNWKDQYEQDLCKSFPILSGEPSRPTRFIASLRDGYIN